MIENPVAEVYTNPRSSDMARDYFADVDAFEARGIGWGSAPAAAEVARERDELPPRASRAARSRVRRAHRGGRTLGAQDASDPHAVQPERPTVATHAGTVAPGWLEIETGVEHDRFDPGVSTAFTPTVLKFGLASHAQLSVFGSAVHDPATTGFGDVGVGVKWRLARRRARSSATSPCFPR